MNYKRYGRKFLRSVISASPKQLWRALMDTIGEECFSDMSRPRAVLPTSEIPQPETKYHRKLYFFSIAITYIFQKVK